MLEIRSLSKSFGYFQVWNDISISLEKERVLGLFGVNGSGKTTLLKSIAGIVSPNSGEILVHGKDLRKHGELRRHIGFLSHQSMYYHDLSCIENLRFTASLYGYKPTRRELLSVLEKVGLARWADEAAKVFSRGMHQRLALSKSLLHDPDLILFDEPFTGLDEEASDMLSESIRSLRSEGKSVVLVTHDIRQGYELCDDIALLANHALALSGPKDQISFDDLHTRFRQKEAGT